MPRWQWTAPVLAVAVAVAVAIAVAPGRPGAAPASAPVPRSASGGVRACERAQPSVVTVEAHARDTDATSAMVRGDAVAAARDRRAGRVGLGRRGRSPGT